MTICESFLRKIWGHSIRCGTREEVLFTKVFSTKIIFSTNFLKFLPQKFCAIWYGMTLNVPLSVKYLLVLACRMLQEGSCVNSADIMVSIYALKCTQQFECYNYTLYIGMHYAKRFRSNSKTSSTQLTKIQYTQL